MDYTENYQLSLWEMTDAVKMNDFNSDNRKIDAALASKADTSAITALNAQIAACGNCRIVTGSYTGTGKYGKSNPNSLTFDKKPLLLFVGSSSYNMIAAQSSGHYNIWDAEGSTNYYGSIVKWSETGVSWYRTDNVDLQMNTSGTTYQYIALVEC